MLSYPTQAPRDAGGLEDAAGCRKVGLVMTNISSPGNIVELDVTGAPATDIDYWSVWPFAFFSLLLGGILNSVSLLSKSPAPKPSPFFLWGLPALGAGIPIAAYLCFLA
jgi:hypothetical protein